MNAKKIILPLNLEFSNELLEEFYEFVDWSMISVTTSDLIPKKIINEIPTKYQYRFLHQLVDRLDLYRVEDLLNKGVDPDVITDNNKTTALYKIVQKAKDSIWAFKTISTNYVDIVKLLLKYGANTQANLEEQSILLTLQNSIDLSKKREFINPYNQLILEEMKSLVYNKSLEDLI